MQIAILVATAALSVASHRNGMTAACPAALHGETVTVRAPSGWRGASQPVIRLVAAGMMAGPPESRADLVPYRQRRIKHGTALTWVFDGGEKWFVCAYGSSAVQIAKRLDDSTTQCTVRQTETGLPTTANAVVECSTEKWKP